MSEALMRDSEGLVTAARDGDPAAFEALMRAHLGAVYAHALRFFGDPATAEDVTQEVFIKVYRSLSTFDGRSAFSTWLYRLTRNTCLDSLRAARRRPVPVDPVDLVGASGGDPANEVVAAEALDRAVAALAPEDRDAFNAITLFGLGYEEAALSLGVPVGTVKSRVFRARRTLCDLLGLTREGV